MNKQQLTNAFKQKFYQSLLDIYKMQRDYIPTLEEIDNLANDITDNIDLRYGEFLLKFFDDYRRYLLVGNKQALYLRPGGMVFDDTGKKLITEYHITYEFDKNAKNNGINFAKSIAKSCILTEYQGNIYAYGNEILPMDISYDDIEESSLDQAFKSDFNNLKDETKGKVLSGLYTTPDKIDAELSLLGEIFAAASYDKDDKLKELEKTFPNFYATSMALIDDLMKKQGL